MSWGGFPSLVPLLMIQEALACSRFPPMASSMCAAVSGSLPVSEQNSATCCGWGMRFACPCVLGEREEEESRTHTQSGMRVG